MLTMASVCLIPFATGFLFKFYNYTNVNIFFSLLILIISPLYILMFILLIRDNFKKYFEKKDEIKATVNETYYDGVELPNLKLYFRGVMLTLFYILMTPVLSSVISLILAFFFTSGKHIIIRIDIDFKICNPYETYIKRQVE